VLGGCGAWRAAGLARSGCLVDLVEHDESRLLIDSGCATLPGLLEILDAVEVDAVLISHGHPPDRCADLNPLLRPAAAGRANVPNPATFQGQRLHTP
jgi:glyoxylase-like metal-dependent hydrolase (beta-lactamase superfamily II)